MIFLVIAALLVNMNSMVYFFEIPYQAVGMGGDQNVISVLNVIHAVIYVISAGVSSGRLRSDRRPMKLLRILILCITSVYTVTCFAQSVNWLYVLVGLHGFLVGLFWSVFWSAFYQKQIKYRMKMSTLTISSAICAVVGPFFAGRVYLLIEKYVLLLFAGLLLIVMLLEKPLNVWMDRSFVKITHYIDERTKRKGEPKKNRSIYQIRQGTGYAQGLGVIVLFWLGILLAGCLEGIFRSAMAVYLLDYHIGSDAWGMLQSVKLLAQTFTLAAIRYAGENRFVFTGDAEEDAEEDMLSMGMDLSADVFKAAHHGSDTANTMPFLEEVHPESVVISCGEDNRYGHPRAEVLNNLRSMGIHVYRTDEQGTIVAVSDGSTITWNCSPSESWKAGEPSR